jgi:hypothetical protein
MAWLFPMAVAGATVSFVGALIEVAHANRLEGVPSLFHMRGHSMCVCRLLILPRFNDREMTRPTNLLEQVHTNVAVFVAGRVAILPEHCDRNRSG